MRVDKRKPDELRYVTIVPDYISYPEGSVLISTGRTMVLCNVSIEDTVPNWMTAQGISGGWITAEYAMLPRSTHHRIPRERNQIGGRTHEIRRIIGRSLRAAVDLEKLGPRTCIIDCDVLQADGGTRTAAITGGYVALVIALQEYFKGKDISDQLIKSEVAAVSVGIVDGIPMLDLCYTEDAIAEVDSNIAMTSKGEFIELQCTGENTTFSRHALDEMLNLAYKGIGQLFETQKSVLELFGSSKKY